MHAFVGRTAELEVLHARVRSAAAGRPGLVLVEGEAGAGKTALVRQALDTSGAAAVWARGDPVERSLPLGVVHQLLRQGPEPTVLPPRDGVVPAAARVLSLVDHHHHRASPLVVVVDDVHWADEPSLQALLFAFRRLQADRLLLLLTARPTWHGAAADAVRSMEPSGTATRVVLGGLGLAAVRRLAVHHGHAGLGPTVLRDLLAHTGGSPGHLCELLRSTPTCALTTVSGLPAPPALATTVAQRLSRARPPARDLVAAVAVLGGRPSLVLAAAVAGVQDPHPALAEAVDLGLLDRPAGAEAGVVSAHPLVAAAVRGTLRHDVLVGLHRAAAVLVDDEAARLRHRVAAADRADEGLLRDLLRHGDRAAAEGGWSTAAVDCARAADLELDPARRRAIWLRAAEAGMNASDADQAERFLAQAADDRSPEAAFLRGRLAALRGRHDEATVEQSAAFAAATAAGDHRTAARSAHQLAWLALHRGCGADVVRWAGAALGSGDVPLELAAQSVLAVGRGITGRSRAALEELPPTSDPPTLEQTELSIVRGTLRLYLDDLAGARADLRAVLATPATRNHPMAFVAQANLAEVEQRAGHWDDAVLHGQLAVSCVVDAEHLWLAAPTYALAATVPARRGQWDDARRLVHAAREAAEQVGDALGEVYAATAAARLADSRGDWAAVVRHTDPLAALVDRGLDGAGEPGISDWQELRAEALVRRRQLEPADALLRALAAAAREREHRSGSAAVDRVRGLLDVARDRRGSADAAFGRAAEQFADLGYAFCAARTALDHGTAARTWGDRRASERLLAQAAEALAALGAAPFLLRVPGAGAGPAEGAAPERLPLRPQELAIAMLVAEGRTNREIAQELVLSVKTVEFHLSQVYRRNGLRSRSQLAARVSRVRRDQAPVS